VGGEAFPRVASREAHQFATVFSGERCSRGRRMCGRSMPTCSR
jgi:hypothetical protein